MMQLVPNWKAVLQKSWSIKLMAAAGLLSGAEAALPYLDSFLPIPQGLFAGLSLVVTAAAFVARLLAQQALYQEQSK